MNDIKILLVDDDMNLLKTLREQLALDSAFEIVGEASSGQQAIDLAVQLVPDVILMDIKMNGMSGIEATRQIMLNSPHIRIIMLTIFEDDATVFSAIRAGASGYLLKGIEVERLLRAVRSVYDGEAIFSADIARRLVTFFEQSRPLRAQDIFPQLTRREAEVLDAMVAGLNYQETADHLDVSVKRVRNLVANVLNKLQVIDRLHAVERAVQAGLR